MKSEIEGTYPQYLEAPTGAALAIGEAKPEDLNVFFHTDQDEILRFCTNGDVYHMGKLLDNDKEILPLLKAFLNGQVNPPKIDAQQQKIDAAIEELEGLQLYTFGFDVQEIINKALEILKGGEG